MTAPCPRRRPSARGRLWKRTEARKFAISLSARARARARARNLLLLVPTVLVLIASIATNYAVAFLPLNLMAWAVLCLFPKLPMMHGVRMFGINSTPGIDR